MALLIAPKIEMMDPAVCSPSARPAVCIERYCGDVW